VTLPLSDLPITDETVIYLRPLCGAGGSTGPAARIGGAWAGFDALEVIIRKGVDVIVARGSLDDVNAWAANLGALHKARVDGLLARLTAPRPPLAGITFDAPRLMGVLNVTPDSFSDGGDYATAETAIPRGRELVAGGAAILDIGGESTKPGSDPVAEADELSRVIPVIEALAQAGTGAVISIDTRKAAVMEWATAAGAALINDISALADDDQALAVAASSGAGVILMHCQGEPKTMQQAPVYDHPPLEIFDYLEARIQACEAAGIDHGRIIVDPGIGFGKALRKSFIGRITGEEGPKARLPGSLAATMAGLNQGVQMVRVHDVAETRQAFQVWQAIHGGGTAN
jgi:dihydropteroate synthase